VLEEAKIPRAYCWAHARREFLPLEDHDPTVEPILDLIDKIFAVEREAKSFDDLKILRASKSIILAQELKLLLLREFGNSRNGSQKRKAILYLQTRWQGFTQFLTDTRIPLSNNEAERTIRHVVVGRKNYYGSGNHTGAETAATLFTIIESCKKNEIDPRSFLVRSLHLAALGEALETPLAYARRTRSHSQPA
jgi:transposase